jgi:AcrR family transcriptional regulator
MDRIDIHVVASALSKKNYHNKNPEKRINYFQYFKKYAILQIMTCSHLINECTTMTISERKKREKKKRRQDIIIAAEKVFFSKGLHQATIEDVAAEAELSKGTVYLYFKNREEIIAAIFANGMIYLQKLMLNSVLPCNNALEKLRALGKAYLCFANNHPNHFALMLEKELHKLDADSDKPEAEACFQAGIELLTMLRAIIIEGIQEKLIREDIDPGKIAFMVWGQIHGVIAIASNEQKSTHFQQFCTFNLETIVTDTVDLIINGIKKP